MNSCFMKANLILAYRFLRPLPALYLRTYLFTFPLGHSVPIPGFPACPQTKQEHLPQGLCTCYALCFESLSSPYLPSSPFHFLRFSSQSSLSERASLTTLQKSNPLALCSLFSLHHFTFLLGPCYHSICSVFTCLFWLSPQD